MYIEMYIEMYVSVYRNFNIPTDLLERHGDTGEVTPTTDCFSVNSAVRWYVPPPS